MSNFTLFDRILYPDLMKMGLYLHAGGPGLTLPLESLSSLLKLMINEQGLKVTEKALLAVAYQAATNVSEVKLVTETFPKQVKEFDEV